MQGRTDLPDVAVVHAIYVLCILVLAARLLGRPQLGLSVGYVLLLMALPLGYLLLKAPQLERPVLYYVQIGLMLAFLLVELLLDYVLKIEFRQLSWMVIAYVTVFFTATGGMLGVAAYGGRPWTISAVILFCVMAALAFVPRAVTGA